MENLTDYDLDVMNLLKDFPQNDKNAFIYIRGESTDEGVTGFTSIKANKFLFGSMILNIMTKIDWTYDVIIAVVINILLKDKSRMGSFLDTLKSKMK